MPARQTGHSYLRKCNRPILSLFFVVLVVSTFLSCIGSALAAAPISMVFRGSAERKWIALTFDDNTIPAPTLETLRVLRHYEVPASLFVCGAAIDAFPDITAAMADGVEAGLFEVGDHSANHVDLTTMPSADLQYQISDGTDAFAAATGVRTVPLFRPPYGRSNSAVAAAAAAEGFTHLVLWDTGTEDWTGTSAESIERDVVTRAHNGAIVLLHMAAPNTAAALPGIITKLRAAGYQLVPVSAMLRDRLFVDVDPRSELGQALPSLTSRGIMSGYDAHFFGAGDTLTRRQAAKIMILVAGVHTPAIDHSRARTFWDVPPTYDAGGAIVPYPYDFVEEAAAAGLIQGSVDAQGRQVLEPDTPITRLQLAHILARMCRDLKGYRGTATSPSAAFADVPAYARGDVNLVAQLGLMRGFSTNRFGAHEPALRSHVAIAMARYMRLARP